MSSFSYFLGGAAAGAGLMYFFDPEQGNRRRALLRDKAYKYHHRGSEKLDGKAEHLSNRAYGLYAETKSTLWRKKDEMSSTPAEQTTGPTMQHAA